MEPLLPVFASERVSRLAISAIKEMAIRASRMEDVASLTWGLPSFRTPVHVREAVHCALRADPDVGKYTLPDGLPDLRRAAAEAHLRATGVAVSADRHVLVTAGNMEGVKVVLDTVLDVGDEVIVTDPGFVSHIHQIRASGGVPVFWPLLEEQGWAADVGSLEALITSRTRVVLLVTPSNPTGTVLRELELLRIGELARRYGVLVILDDPYSRFVFGGRERYFNLASVRELSDHIAYLFTFSKCHAMSGWRVGYAVLPEELKRQVLKIHDATLICAPRPSQVAALAALGGSDAHVFEFANELDRRRSLICERLERVPHVFSYVPPEGAYYVFPKLVAKHVDSLCFSLDLLGQARVCVTPGSAFGPSGEGHVRMAFCVPEDEINKAFDRIERYFPS